MKCGSGARARAARVGVRAEAKDPRAHARKKEEAKVDAETQRRAASPEMHTIDR